MQTTKETWQESELHRMAGDLALMSPEPDTAKAQAQFDRALAVARQHQAKSWELRAAMSMARLCRDQGKEDKARELLASAYNGFTEGFETPDLKEAKALLDVLGKSGASPTVNIRMAAIRTVMTRPRPKPSSTEKTPS